MVCPLFLGRPQDATVGIEALKYLEGGVEVNPRHTRPELSLYKNHKNLLLQKHSHSMSQATSWSFTKHVARS